MNTKIFLKNLRYILKHKYYVFIECCKVGMPIRGLIHDASKFSISEFKPYAMYFFSGDSNEIDEHTRLKREEEFELAWLHHKNVNPHHWDYWVDIDDNGEVIIHEMPLTYVKEMLCDWIGAGMAISGKADSKEFYLKTKHKIFLHPNTRKYVEKELGIIND